jgi:hypothetical protein
LFIHERACLATDKPETVLNCTRLGYQRGWYDGLLIVDSVGHGFRIAGAKKKRVVVSNGRELFGLLTGNAHWEVELVPTAEGKIHFPFQEIKNRLLKILKTDRGHWEEMSDLETFESELRRAENFQTLFAIFRKQNHL